MINKHINQILRVCLVGCSLATAFSACSDFSDYNDTPVDQQGTGNLTLWENISQNGQLSDFAQLVKRAGFDTKLSQANAYTVWAPLNGTFNAADYSQLSDSMLLQQFVMNHVAKYVHGASGKLEERIHTLNEKSYDFTGDGTYTFGGVDIAQPNQASSNGVMHLLNGVARFSPNLFEYLSTADGIAHLRDYFMQYNDTTLSDESVKGPMVNGVQTYLDSVLVISNTLTRALGAKIENEDSSYTFVMPTDTAYTKMYNRVKPLYNFIPTTKVRDPENYSSASANTEKPAITVNSGHLSDSLTRRAIVRNLIFSNNDAYNEWVTGKGVYTDTLRSTTRTKLSNPNDILSKYRVGEPQEMSNGKAHLVDSLAFYPWETFNPQVNVYTRGANVAKVFTGTIHNESVPDSLVEQLFGPKMAGTTNFRYSWIEPSSATSKPDIFILLPSVLSTTYNFYVVFMPSAMRQFGNEPRPNMLNFQLNYCNKSGNLADYYFSKGNAKNIIDGIATTNVTKVDTTTAFKNNPLVTDTVFIGQFTFPVAYNGLGDDYKPYIRITSPINVLKKEQLAAYSRDVRIAAIIMKPVEYDEFEAKNK